MEIVSGDSVIHDINPNGDVLDIIKGIMDADKCQVPYVVDFAPMLQGATIYETCANIYEFVHGHIPYNEDEEGRQWIQSAGELWNNRYSSKGGTGDGGDCKSMSMLCSALLKANGIWDFKFRFISEDPDQDLYHVYIIVKNDEGDGYIVLDCTLPRFDYELNVAKLMDVDPAPANSICPFPQPVESPSMGSALIGGEYMFNTSLDAEENQGLMWATHETNFRNNGTSEAKVLELRNEVIRQLEYNYRAQPVKKDKVRDFIRDEWANFMKTSALMIYHYWGDVSLEMGDFRGKVVPPLSEVDIKIGATEINIKQQVGRDFYDDLIGIGINIPTIKQMVALSVWNNHGITMDYMLYRCYNKLTYGQEWGVIPGVPYYDANTKIFYPNGANFSDFLALAFAFPLEGGTGKAWGIPYISRGIYVMTNGASQAALRALTDQINRLGWNEYINTRIFQGGTEDWVSKIISEPQALQATTVYYKWLQGHLPVLYANPVTATLVTAGNTTYDTSITLAGPHIGELTAAVAGLVTAIVTAVVGIIAAIVKFVTSLKSNQEKMIAHPGIAPTDFKFAYVTKDGCMIGYMGSCPSGMVKRCPTGDTCDPDLNLPDNNPQNNNFLNPGCMDPASQFFDPLATEDDGSCVDGAPKTNMKLYAGVAIAAGVLLLVNGGKDE